MAFKPSHPLFGPELKAIARSLTALLLLPSMAWAESSFDLARQQLEERGVSVLLEHPRCSERNLFGLYVRGRRQVVVCSRGNQTNTLLHESWHLVQSQCLKGSPYVDEVQLRMELPRRDRRELEVLYTAQQWQREAEARYMAIQPMDRYFSAMDALCPMLPPKLPKVQPLS